MVFERIRGKGEPGIRFPPEIHPKKTVDECSPEELEKIAQEKRKQDEIKAEEAIKKQKELEKTKTEKAKKIMEYCKNGSSNERFQRFLSTLRETGFFYETSLAKKAADANCLQLIKLFNLKFSDDDNKLSLKDYKKARPLFFRIKL